MRAALRAGLALSGLLLLAAIVMAVVAIWTVGPDADRWGGTAVVLGFVGFTAAALFSIGLSEL